MIFGRLSIRRGGRQVPTSPHLSASFNPCWFAFPPNLRAVGDCNEVLVAGPSSKPAVPQLRQIPTSRFTPAFRRHQRMADSGSFGDRHQSAVRLDGFQNFTSTCRDGVRKLVFLPELLLDCADTEISRSEKNCRYTLSANPRGNPCGSWLKKLLLEMCNRSTAGKMNHGCVFRPAMPLSCML